jgi:hypothetical protein
MAIGVKIKTPPAVPPPVPSPGCIWYYDGNNWDGPWNIGCSSCDPNATQGLNVPSGTVLIADCASFVGGPEKTLHVYVPTGYSVGVHSYTPKPKKKNKKHAAK